MLGDTGIEIIWRDSGWQELARELISGTSVLEREFMEVVVMTNMLLYNSYLLDCSKRYALGHNREA